MKMKCQVCKIREAEPTVVVCSADCSEIRLMINRLVDVYAPTHGCENCWGDLNIGCTEQCRREFIHAGNLSHDLYLLVRMAFNSNTP